MRLNTFIFFYIRYGIIFLLLCQQILTKAQTNENNFSDSVPHHRSVTYNTSSATADSLIVIWAKKETVIGKEGGKVNNPRIWLARFHAGYKIKELNKEICNTEPWGKPGTSWLLNKKGDYDFTLTILTTILWKYGDRPELLYPKTKEHILNKLHTSETNRFRTRAPRTLGIIPETENHILMTEGSRYLKNRWMYLHGDTLVEYDNLQNKLEYRLVKFLRTMKNEGLHEFNSMPYSGYTITALLNLEAFSSDSVKAISRDILDYINYSYALGTYQFKYFPPMRRQLKKEKEKALTTHYTGAVMKTWLSFTDESANQIITSGSHHALVAAVMTYRPSDGILSLFSDDAKRNYYIQLGHGKRSSPEIYDVGTSYLLSAGGVHRGKISMIVSRPIVLFLNDSAKHLNETFHLYGPGNTFKKWNNTGVYHRFACAAGPVNIPNGFNAVAKNKLWSIYRTNSNLLIAVHSSNNAGIIALFEHDDPDKLLSQLSEHNGNPELLKTGFRFSEGDIINYDLKSPKNRWVIKQVNGKAVDRKFDKWNLINREEKN